MNEEEVKQIVKNIEPMIPVMLLVLYMKSFIPVAEKATKMIIEQEMKKYEVSRC